MLLCPDKRDGPPRSQSNRSLCLDCVRSIDDRDRPKSPHSKSYPSISRCRRRTWLFCPSTRPEIWARSGQNFAKRNFGGGGSRTPVRKALQLEDYMLVPFRLFHQESSERARRAPG